MGRRPILALLALLAVPLAAETPVLTSPAPDKVAVTVYRAPDRGSDEAMELDWLQGYALITEQRTVDIPEGRSTVRFEGVAGGMLPESALVAGLPGGVSEKNLDADLLSPASLYARSLGRPVILRRTHDASGKITEERGVIRSGPEGAAILQTSAGYAAVECGVHDEELVYAEVPAGLSARPTLSVELTSPRAQRVTMALSYLAWGFDWQTNYVVTMEEDSRKAVMTAWVTLASSDPTSFTDAETALIGGGVNREDEREDDGRGEVEELEFKCFIGAVYPTMLAMPAPMEAMAVGFADDESAEIIVTAQRREEKMMSAPLAITVTEEGIGDLRLYRVPIPTTVAANAQKQVALFDRKRVDVSVVHFARVYEGDIEDGLKIQLRSRNRKQEGLGLALPGGPVTVFAPYGEERLLIGEGGLPDRAVGEDIELAIAAPTQVTLAIEETDDGDDWEDNELTATNANPWPVTLEVLMTYDIDGKKLEKLSARLGKKDGWPVWQTTIPANGEVKLRYRLREVE